MIGGLGGLGGFDPGNALGAIGMSLLSSPRDNPLQNLPQFIGEANKNAERAYQVKALEEALVAAGLPRAEAQVMARSPDAAKVRLETLKQQKADAANTKVQGVYRDIYGGEGGPLAPAATPGPRSDAGSGAIESRFLDTVRANGLTNPNGLAAVAAYGRAESGYSPANVNRTWSDPSESGQAGTSGGIMSWRNERLAKLNEFARAKGEAQPSVETQAEFLVREDPTLIPRLNAAKSPEEANAIMANAWRFAGYNRPGGENQRRLDLTRAYVPRVAGQQGADAPAPASAPAPDWRTAQDSPETFAAKLAQARGGSAGLSIAPAAPPAEPVPAPAAPTMPATAPLPPVRPAGLGAAPSVPTMGLPPPGVDPHAGDAGAKAFAASGMGRPAPVLTPPAPMALAGQATAPARVTSPVAPLPAPPPAPPPPPPRAADLPVENAVPAQGPAPAPQTQAPTEPRAIAAERKLETVVQSGPTRLPSEYQGKTQSSLAQQHFQKALKLEMAASTPNLPENSAKAARELAKYHFDVAKEYLKPAEIDRQIDRLDLPEAQKQAIRRNAIEDKRPSIVREAEISLANPQLGEEMIRQRRAGAQNISIGPNGEPLGNPEAGLVWKRGPDGKVVFDERGAPIAIPYQGGKAYKTEQDEAKQTQQREGERKTAADVVTDDIDRALKLTTNAIIPTTGLIGSQAAKVPNTAAHDVSKLLDSVKANVTFDKLQRMREASPTGGALGQVTEGEHRLLSASLGSLEQSQSYDQFVANLRRVKNVYLDIVHGPGNGPPREQIESTAKPAERPAGVTPPAPPARGEVRDGYRFLGGDPANPKSWRKVGE